MLIYDGCDVDYVNIEGATPLHLAVKITHPPLRALIVDSLLDAGADKKLALFLSCGLPLPRYSRLHAVSRTMLVN